MCKKVDCIILTILKEEREHFLSNNKFFIMYETKSEAGVNYTEFDFLDKNSHIRKGVICDFGKRMGITNAIKFFHLISQKYKSLLYINAGVAAGIKRDTIGDVFCIEELQTICENNDTSVPEFQFKGTGDIPIDKYCGLADSDIIRESSGRLIKEIIDNGASDANILNQLFKRKHNKIASGKCVTTNSVIKDKETRDKLKSIRKSNVIEMEAYYIYDWFKLLQSLQVIEEKAEMLIFKVPSDTGVESEKELLERLGARDLAMSNLYMVVSHLICTLYQFHGTGLDVIKYWNENIFEQGIDDYAKKKNGEVLHNYFGKVIYDNQYNQISFDILCENICTSESITIIEGDAGTGKSTLLGLIYRELKKENNLLYIDLKSFDSNTNHDALCYCLKRIIQTTTNITLLIDSLTGDYEQNSDPSMKIFLELQKQMNSFSGVNVNLCIGSDISNSKWTKSRIYERDLTTNKSNVFKIYLLKETCYSKKLEEIIMCFAKFYYEDVKQQEDFITTINKYIIENSISFIDFRLLIMFAQKFHLVKKKSFFDFIHGYFPNDSVRKILIDAIHNKYEYNQNHDEFKLMYKNIYTRSFMMSFAILDKILKKDFSYFKENILIFSDNINFFFNNLVNEHSRECIDFLRHMESYENVDDSLLSIKIQILYALSNSKDVKYKNTIIGFLAKEFEMAKQRVLRHDTSPAFVIFRTTGIALARIKNSMEPMDDINEIVCRNQNLRRYNLYFHLMYYSQQEFSYNDISASLFDVRFETLVITFDTLKRQCMKNSLLMNHILLTLLSLAEFSGELSYSIENFRDLESLLEDSIENFKENNEEIYSYARKIVSQI